MRAASILFLAALFLAELARPRSIRAQTSPPTRPDFETASAASQQADKPHLEPVSVREFGASLGLDPTWNGEDKELRLESRWTELVFQPDKREVKLNGLRLFLGEGTTFVDGKLCMSPIDRDRMLKPILAPALNKPRDPVKIIALDPGHGGRDKGTRNIELKLFEKTFTIDVARRLKDLLEARGFTVMLTRDDDTYIDLEERPVRAATAGADLFLSIHFNATGSADVRGLETYILTPQFQYSTGNSEPQPEDNTALPGNPFDGWNAYLGYTMHRVVVDQLKLPDRGLKHARFVVLCGLNCPGLLVEGGFLTNPEEAKLIASDDYRDRLAAAMAAGIDVYNETLRRLKAARESDAGGGG